MKAILSDAAELLKMQKEAFRPLYDRYQDEGSPYLEPLAKVEARLSAPHGGYYWICLEDVRVGAVWAGRRAPGKVHLGPLFILPAWQNRGIGQAALLQLEEIMGPGVWELDTLLQEPGNCHLYEKLGYVLTGEKRIVNDRLTLVDYEKIVKRRLSADAKVTLAPVESHQIPLFYQMQICSFAALLRRYRDDEQSPGAESLERVRQKLTDPAVALAAFIQVDGVPAGGIRIKYSEAAGERQYLLSTIFVLPEYRGQKIAQKAIQLAEKSLPPAAQWQLITIQQEAELRHLYEKMGYRPTGVSWNIHPQMDLIQYQKNFVK